MSNRKTRKHPQYTIEQKNEIPSKGRPKMIDFKSMSKEELIKCIKSGEDIKKRYGY